MYAYLTRFWVLTINCMLLISGCNNPTTTHEETTTIKPVQVNTLNDTSSGGGDSGLCLSGIKPDQPGLGQMIVGFFHRYHSDDDCWVNQIYEGMIRFQIDAAPFYKRLIKSATLNLPIGRKEANPPRNSCIDKLGLTDVDWWVVPRSGLIHVNELRNLTTIPPQTFNIDVTQEVQRWANNTDENNGFVFIGQRPEESDFSNDGMLTNETCEAFYQEMSLTVTYFQFDKEPHHPSISVNATHTQTTTDITVKGTDFTPQSTVAIFADDVEGRNGSIPLGTTTTDANGKFNFFNRSQCVRQPVSATIRALDDASGDNARGYAPVYCN